MNSIDFNGIEITVKDIIYNQKNRCSKGCYDHLGNSNICLTKKALSIEPSEEEVIFTMIILNIKNKSDNIWNASSGPWELIDSDGFAFAPECLCNELTPLRLFNIRRWNLSPKTQGNYFLIFPEMQNKISKLIYALGNSVHEIVIEKYSDEIEESFNYDKPLIETNLSARNSFYMTHGFPELRAIDGHFVRSKNEVIVDNYLFNKKINHIYECGLPGLELILCDWYLPDLKTFVEFWGISNDINYEENKKRKLQIYEANNFNLISIEKNDLANLDQVFTEKLSRLGYSIEANYLRIENNELSINTSFIAIDFETANQRRNSACALGIVIVEHNRIKVKKEYYIKPPSDFFTFTDYHGISWENVKDSPTFPEIWKEIRMIFDSCPNLVAHNMPFDKGVLTELAEFYKLEIPQYNYMCTMKESRRHISAENHKLDTIATKLNIELLHHNALSDANAAAEILMYINNIKSKSVTT